jgi:PKD domain/Concanavalin A-like lectin/glucanases superfamily/Right handed beta helix region
MAGVILMHGMRWFVAFKGFGALRKIGFASLLQGLCALTILYCTQYLIQPALSDNQTTTAHSSRELLKLLAAAQGGEVLYLDPAEVELELKLEGITLNAPVTIRPLKARAPFNISYLKITNSKNLIFDGLAFSIHRKSGVESGPSNIEISGSHNITITNCNMLGTANRYLTIADVTNRSADLSLIRYSDGITFTNNSISAYFHGLQFLEVRHLTVTGNEIQKIQGDGLRMGGVADVIISRNNFYDFLGSDQEANHSDMLQLWSTNAVIKSHNIRISDNTFNSAGGSATQTIFMRNELADQPQRRDDQFYSNIVIENNLIYNGHPHGITIGETNGLRIAHNTLLYNPQSSMGNGNRRMSSAPSIQVSKISTTVQILNNVTGPVVAGPDADVRGNLIINNSSSSLPTYVGMNFVGATSGGALPSLALHVLTGSLADGDGLGSTLNKQAIGDWKNGVFFTAREVGEKTGNMVFEAKQLPIIKNLVEQEGVRYVWDFGDGGIATGSNVQHAYEAVGRFKVTLRIVGSNTQIGEYWNYVTVTEPLLFRLESDGANMIDASTYHSEIKAKLQTSQLGPIFGLSTLTLDRDSHIEIGRGEKHLYDLEKFGMSFFFKCDSWCQAGTILMIHKSFDLRITDARELQFQLVDSTGRTVTLHSGRTRIANGAWHQFVLNYDANEGNAKLIIDGVLVMKTIAKGPTQNMQSWGLVLGGQFGNSVQGILAGFELSRLPYGARQIADQLKLMPQ